MKLEPGDNEEDIKAWSVEIEQRLVQYEKVVEGLERNSGEGRAIQVGY